MNLSLRSRFLAAIGLIVALIVGAFAFGLWQFVEVLESELLNHTLARELHEFADRFAHEPTMTPPAGADLTGYVVLDGAPGTLPPALRELPAGLHDDVLVGEREMLVGRKDVNGARLYLALDIAPVEELEDRLVGIAVACAAVAFVLAVLCAIVLSGVVMRPVTRLSNTVGALDPRQRGVRLLERFDDREVRQIAAAIDRYLAQLDSYIEREHGFTEDASHELRTPLATILSAVQLLLEAPEVTSQARERLTRIRRAGIQIQSLIEALLMLAREDGGESAQDCALDEVLREAAASLGDAATQRGVTLHVEVQPVTRRVVPGMADSVVNNLLLNAIHHSGPGTVRARLDAQGLTVEDQGSGIAPQDLSRIFERRYRGTDSRGLGLGLYLVKRMCDRLGWKVVARSDSAGTQFVISFPA
ncbi:MAG TPA: HAMP domain-containing sensor histidine kinase [Verrucomicrobiae bacterium]|nr:HAMP domain-containing sensor histidine kinase [Verrucomicrobiae bacterium]